jgi:hypothetical protein
MPYAWTTDQWRRVFTFAPGQKFPGAGTITGVNRRNASRSTGPKTARGKKTVSRNALKQGLLAREVVITSGSGEESVEEFQEMIEGLRAYFQPLGILEEMLVERIATSWWRLARVLRAENGEICRKLDSAFTDFFNDLFNNLSFTKLSLGCSAPEIFARLKKEGDQKTPSEETLLSMQKFGTDLRKDELGLFYLHQILLQVKREVSETGTISQCLREVFTFAFFACEFEFANEVLNGINKAIANANEGIQLQGGQATQPAAAVIKAIDLRIEGLTVQRRSKAEGFLPAEEAERRALYLPSREATDKLLRYEITSNGKCTGQWMN